MKRTLFQMQLALLFSITVFSQTGNSFKTISRNQAGTTNPDFPYKKISGSTVMKSGLTASSNNRYYVSDNLPRPGIKTDTLKSIRNKQGVPIFFEKEKTNMKSARNETIEEQFYSFHNLAKPKTSLSNPQKELVIKQKVTDELGITHIKAQQFFKGVKVYGAESYLHIGPKKDIYTGYIYPVDINFNVTPEISKESALGIVETDLKSRTVFKNLAESQKELLKYKSPDITLIIYDNLLAYEVDIRPNFIETWKYFVDARTGGIVRSYNNTQSDGPATATGYDLNNILRTINTYLESGSYILLNASETMYNASTQEGVIMTLDANNTSTVNLEYSTITSANNTWSDKTAVSAHYNAAATYKYFKNTFGRNSINGQGGNILSFINVTNEDGSSMENAFWNGKAAFYGNGGSNFDPLAGALDVAAHELGHGIISNTANLEYYGQSGAMNEGFADIFGAMVDRDDWHIGEDITKTTFSPSGALRNMSNPHNMGSSSDAYWQPKHLSEMYTGEEDNGGVHINSGIVNYAYYLYATAITKEKAEQVFYRALENYLTSKSQFIDLRIAVIQSAKDLYGENSQESVKAGNAFDAVGIYEETSIDYAQDYPVNPGQDYLLTYDTDQSNPYTLYRSSTMGTDYYALTTTDMKTGVSVSDDGSAAVFVATDDKIKAISTDPNNIQEFYLSDEAFFDNVAISKDANRLAAISTEIDTSIYVYDLVSQQWARFILYNPTTSHDGTDAGGVVFADAIEFDHTGEYLIYDAFNLLNSASGEDISYWDIGFIKIWDNSSNDFGDGTINKLYGSLPENVSIGNPTFSKNSPYIIAFDYMNSSTDEYAIFGANLLTGDLDIITANSTLGFPSFSKNDDKVAFSALDNSSKEVVAVIDIDANKITGTGSASIIVEDAMWPEFYTEGIRSLILGPLANFTVDLKSGVAPLTVKFIDLSINSPVSWSWVFEGGTPPTSGQQNPSVTYNSPGTYRVSLTCTNSTGNNTMTKTGYISVYSSTSISEQATEVFSFYPNPTDGLLLVKTDRDFKLKIYSPSGHLLINIENQQEINLSNLANGFYIMQIEIDGRIFTDKIIKQ